MNATQSDDRRNFAIAGIAVLVAALLLTLAAYKDDLSLYKEVANVATSVVGFPCRAMRSMSNFSLDRLNPTCPQCNSH